MIPSVAHFVWLGHSLPWMLAVALQAARARGGFDRVILHHTDALDGESLRTCARQLTAAELCRIEPETILANSTARGSELVGLWRRLTTPAARSNVLRLAILALQGGVYLDTDVIAVRPFLPLLDAGLFCGSEHIALPAKLSRSRNPLSWARAVVRLGVRDVLRRVPNGHRWFRAVEARYPAEVNNAVIGAEPGHPFVASLLDAMLRMPTAWQTVRFALGPHLLGSELERQKPGDVWVHPPGVFYPLPPEISQHWFRVRPTARLDDVLSPRTVAVHWYASVRTRRLLSYVDADYVRRNADRQLWSALVASLVDRGYEGAAT